MAEHSVSAPHIGAMIEKILKAKGLTKTDFAGRLGQQPGTVNAMIRQPSLRMYRLWDVCMAMNHDFFADLSNLLPAGMELSAGNRFAERIAELEQQVRDLQKEVEIYEKVLSKK